MAQISGWPCKGGQGAGERMGIAPTGRINTLREDSGCKKQSSQRTTPTKEVAGTMQIYLCTK